MVLACVAGEDSTGQQWASTYDKAAQQAFSVSAKLVTGCGQTRNLIVVGAYNHQVAENAANHSKLPSPPAPQLAHDPCPAT
ncbi:hypothetical protein [Nocardia miyunensis]|uniref:hypothetical protein n=1 Tax=Nocardia miyunensis TaxID=282684 RepID=UPI00082F6223|nr:hypothetical protein [Nocardia miyunensis]